MNYEPEPIDTSGVTLTEEILELTELLAKNAHDIWAQQRLFEGWTWGPERDDTAKKHSDLVPYDQLPESEKQYDRNVAMETLKAILAMGYRIEPPARNRTAAPDSYAPADKELAAVLRILGDPTALDLASSLALWRARNPDRWSHTPKVYRLLSDRILKLGEPLLAYDVLAEGLKHWPEDVCLRQLLALALARSGATWRANAMLVQLHREGHSDEETLGILARTYKDLWAMATESAEREAYLRSAAEVYYEAYQRTGGHWTGINTATTALLLGQRDRAAALAREVRECCLQEMNRMKEGSGDRYWPLASLGEAALILDERSKAEDWYAQAAEVGRGRFGDLSSTRHNARLLMEHLGGDRERIERCFRIPRVVVFAGHMIDQPGRATPRFLPQLERAVHDAIRDRLKKLDARLGYASAACGSDILFLEAILDLNGETHVVLPYDKKQFMEDSVDIIPGAGWGARCEQVLQRATEVLTASEQRMEGGSVLYDYTNLLLHGLASIRAEQLETELVPLAAWNGKPGDGPGGTASIVAHWRDLGHDVELIDLAEILRRECPELTTSPSDIPTPLYARTPELSPEVMAILFADAINFSRLTEEEIPRFVRHFLGAIAELAATSPHAPVMKNTWGDGLYFVFSSVWDAGQFALELCDLMGSTNWAEKGLPKELSLRIALHAGPVYSCTDPVTQRPNYIGTHVIRAARIERITPPGQVYASQAFAALAAAERVSDFTCDYVGQTSLAKGYGTFPTYHVRRRNPRNRAFRDKNKGGTQP